MMDIEKFGGVAVAILMHKTALEIACDDYGDALDSVSGKLSKVMSGNLRKGVSLDSIAQDLLADVRKLQEIADRRHAAFPAFKAWASNMAVVDDGRRFLIASKDADAYGGLGKVQKAGAATTLPSAQQPAIDPSASVTDASLARRFSR
jgi:hypothetical protein